MLCQQRNAMRMAGSEPRLDAASLMAETFAFWCYEECCNRRP